MSTSEPLLQLLCAVLVLLVPVGVQLGLPQSSRRRILTVAAVGLLTAAMSGIFAALGGGVPDTPSLILDAALTGAVASVVALVSALRLGTLPGAVFAVSWSMLVFAPVAAAVLDGVPSLLQVALGAVDYGGVLATHVAAGAALWVLTVLPTRTPAPIDGGSTSWSRAVWGAGLLMVGASAWLLGTERVLTVASGRTLGNAVVGMLLAAVTWVVVEKIALDRVTPAGLVAGVMVGWAAIGGGAPYLSPVALVATAVIGTATAVGVAARPLARGADPIRALALAAVAAALVGGVMLSLLADSFGLAETGTLTLTVAQVGAVIIVGILAVAGGALCWLLAWGTSWWAIPDSNR